MVPHSSLSIKVGGVKLNLCKPGLVVSQRYYCKLVLREHNKRPDSLKVVPGPLMKEFSLNLRFKTVLSFENDVGMIWRKRGDERVNKYIENTILCIYPTYKLSET